MTDPPEGVDVSIADLMVRSKQVQKFEDTNDLLRWVSITDDWDGMTKAFLIRIHERGIPASNAEMIGDIQDWFIAHSSGDDVPSERTIRRHVDDLWKTLTELKKNEDA